MYLTKMDSFSSTGLLKMTTLKVNGIKQTKQSAFISLVVYNFPVFIYLLMTRMLITIGIRNESVALKAKLCIQQEATSINLASMGITLK